jgi:hypothetical protein
MGGLTAFGNMGANVLRGMAQPGSRVDKMLGPQVSSRAIFDAQRDAADETTARDVDRNRLTALAGNIHGLLATGKGLTKGVGLLADLPGTVKSIEALKAAASAVPGVEAAGEAGSGAKAALAARVNPKLLQYGGKVAKAAAGGGTVGAAQGFATGHDLDERIQNAKEMGELGAATGGLFEGVAAPIAKPFLGAGMDAFRAIGAKLGPEVDSAVTTLGDKIAARKAVGALAKAAGVNAGNLGARTAPFSGLDQTAAEALGSTGQNTLASVARRAGATGDALRAQMRTRAAGQPGAIVADFKDMLGVDPEAAAGNIEHMVEAGQKNAGPEFKAYYDATAEGVQDPEVERLLATPIGQKLQAQIETRARNIGRPHEALTYGRVESPAGVQSGNPMEAPPVGEVRIQPHDLPPDLGPAPITPLPRGPDLPPPRGLSLLSWIRRQGHLQDTGGELAAQDITGIGARGKNRLTPTELNGLAQGAREAGYFPELDKAVSARTADNYHQVTGEDLQQAIQEEVAGTRTRYGRSADWRAQQAYDAREAVKAQNRAAESEHWNKQQDATAAFHARRAAQAQQDEISAQAGRELNPDELRATEAPPEGYGGGEAPRFEPAQQTNLVGESLDAIRRRANKAVKWEFGRPVRSGDVGLANEEPAAFSEDFTKALKAGPYGDKLAKALETSSDYLGIKSAFEATKGQLTRGSPRAFGKVWGKLKPGAQQDAARAALASDVIDLWGAGQLRGGKFAAPGIQGKLELAFGRDGAKQFVSQMERRAELAASGARMAPFSGSPTMTLQEAAGATNDMAPLASNLARIGGKVLRNPLAAAGDAIGTLAGTYRRTAGMTPGFRNELGRILSLPSDDPEFVSLLRELDKMPAADRANLLQQVGRVGSGAVQAQPQK